MKSIYSLAALASVLALVGCQAAPYQPYARDVKRRPADGGIIALKTEHRDEDRMKAQQMMASNCNGLPFKVLEEGEVVVGQTTNTTASEDNRAGSSQQIGSLFGVPITSDTRSGKDATSVATTTAVKEWQLNYECEKAVATKSTPAKKTVKQ